MSLSSRGEVIAPRPGPTYPTAHTYDRDTNPEGLVAPAFASNDLVHPELAAFASKVPITPQTFSTTHLPNGSHRLRAALAVHLNETFLPTLPIDESHIVIADTATAVFEMLGFALFNLEDGILTSRPIYRGYVADFGTKAGVKVCFADTSAEESLDPRELVVEMEEALKRYEQRGCVIKGVLISNPNNPLGRCYPRETLIALMGFCQKHALHLISDEIFGASVFETTCTVSTSVPFTSVLSIATNTTTNNINNDTPTDDQTTQLIDPSLIHVIYGLAKDFSAPSLRIGALISQSNPALLGTCKQMLRFHDISGPSCGIATAMLENRVWCRNFLDRHREVLRACYEYATNGLRDIGVRFVEGGRAGFFVFVNLGVYLPEGERGEEEEDRVGREAMGEQRREHGPTVAEEQLVRKMVEHGIYLPPGAERYGEPGWFRFVFTHERHVIDEALRRLKRVIDA